VTVHKQRKIHPVFYCEVKVKAVVCFLLLQSLGSVFTVYSTCRLIVYVYDTCRLLFYWTVCNWRTASVLLLLNTSYYYCCCCYYYYY